MKHRVSTWSALLALTLGLGACQLPGTPGPTGGAKKGGGGQAGSLGGGAAAGAGKATAGSGAGAGSLVAGGSVGADGGRGTIAAGGGNGVAAGGGNIIAAGGGNIVAAGGGNIVAAGGMNLTGVVNVPAGIVAAGGLNLVAAGGGNIVAAGGGNLVAAGGGNIVAAGGLNYRVGGASDGRSGPSQGQSGPSQGQGGASQGRGERYRLQALPSQVVAAGVKVVLLDGHGSPLRDAGGRPFETVTDAAGRYAFAGAPTSGVAIAAVPLEAGFGSLQALITPAGPNAPTGPRQADLDVVTTLATTYVLDQFVKGQPDPQAALDRLTGELERATRDRTREALETTDVATPERLTADRVVAAVEAAKAKSPALAAQLEAVRKALVVAGQADLGSGRPGTEVSVKSPHAFALDGDGALYVASWDHVVYKLGTGGIVSKALGVGTYDANASPAGVPATEAKLERIPHLALDARGRLAALEEGGRLTRMKADGTLEVLMPGFQPYTWVGGLTRAAERLAVFTGDTRSGDVTVSLLEADSSAGPSHTFPKGELAIFEYDAVGLGADGQGRLYLSSSTASAAKLGNTQRVQRIDPATWAVTTLVDTTRDGLEGATVDPAGNILVVEAGTRRLVARKAAGGEVEVAPALPPQLSFNQHQGAVLTPDGGAYLGRDAQVWHVKGATARRVLGTDEQASGNANDLALEEPRGLVIDADGTLYMADRWKRHIVKITAAQAASRFAGGGQGGDGGLATEAALGSPTKLQKDAAGVLYVLESDVAIRRIGAGTKPTIATSVAEQAGKSISDFVAAPDGTLTWVEVDTTDQAHVATLRRQTPGGAAAMAADLPDGLSAWSLGLAADGACYLAAGSKLMRWREGGAIETLAEDVRFDPVYGMGLAVDARNRVIAPHYNTIFRFDPADGSYTVLAGPGGMKYNGETVETSLQWPSFPTFAPNGDLYLADTNHKQVKKIPAGEL